MHSLLPVSIATQLLSGNGVVKPEKFDCVTIYFSDIVNFSALQTWLTPLEVQLCNRMMVLGCLLPYIEFLLNANIP